MFGAGCMFDLNYGEGVFFLCFGAKSEPDKRRIEDGQDGAHN